MRPENKFGTLKLPCLNYSEDLDLMSDGDLKRAMTALKEAAEALEGGDIFFYLATDLRDAIDVIQEEIDERKRLTEVC